jgi:hypothetical protein
MLAWCSLPFTSAIVNAPAFAFQNRPRVHEPQRSKRKGPSYKSFDQMEKDVISSSPSNPRGEEGDETKIENSDSDVEDDNAWLSATRTLGSLFLRQEDAERVKNVDVFRRNRSSLGNDNEGKDAPRSNPAENTFAHYMLDLKLQEEDNRERAAVNQIIKPKTKDTLRESVATHKASAGLEIDHVSETIAGCYFPMPALGSSNCMLTLYTKKIAKELDENVSNLAVSEEIMSDISPLPDYSHIFSSELFHQESVAGKEILRL